MWKLVYKYNVVQSLPANNAKSYVCLTYHNDYMYKYILSYYSYYM